MAGLQKQIKDITLGRDKDIRVRYVKKEDFQTLAECSRLMGTRTVPETVLKLIHDYKGDRALIKQLQARNTQLNAALLNLVNEREQLIKALDVFIASGEKFGKETLQRVKYLKAQSKIISKRGATKGRGTR